MNFKYQINQNQEIMEEGVFPSQIFTIAINMHYRFFKKGLGEIKYFANDRQLDFLKNKDIPKE